MNPLSALARPLDLAYPSNRWALGLTLAGFVLIGLLTHSALEAIAGALWVFATWALGRELDPDQPRTATSSAGWLLFLLVLAPALRFYMVHGMAVTGALMMVARLLGRTTGLKTTPLDLFTLVLMTPLLGLVGSKALWPLGLAAGGALFLDAAYDQKPPRGWLGLGLAVLGGVLLGWLGRIFRPGLPDGFFWGSVLIGVLGWLGLFLRPYLPHTPADSAEPLEAERITSARRVVALVGLLLSFTLSPLIVLSVGLVGLIGWVLKRPVGQ